MAPATRATWDEEHSALWIETEESGHSPIGYCDEIPTAAGLVLVHDFDHDEEVYYDPRTVALKMVTEG